MDYLKQKPIAGLARDVKKKRKKGVDRVQVQVLERGLARK